MNSPANWLKTHFDYRFDDDDLLRRALTHRSADGSNNERLEFLGDSVLNAVAADIVFHARPGADEGQLSRLRSSLVRDATLAEIAADIGVGEHLLLGQGEQRSGGFRRASILADAVEALLGAIYLEGGFPAADRAVRCLLAERAANLPPVEELKDAKTRLQEKLQGEGLGLPDYAMENVSGKAHRQTFEASCTIAALDRRTVGHGSSRRNAEQAAARAMLDALGAAAGEDGTS